ncbi:MAG: YhfC family glutamic-type intramembrane protease [Lachnospiraceae bacterium]|nr:YhfC family glutamic-type intramembrane protease [Lachnospiraceae bacterium]
MNILRDLQYELPTDFDLSAQVPRNTIMGAIIGIVAILAMAIILTVYIRKRQKGGIFDIIVGVAVYMIFFYFASNTVANLLFGTILKSFVDVKPVLITVIALTTTLVPMFGRLLSLKLMGKNMNTAADAYTVGMGIMLTEGFLYMVDLLMVIVSCNTINKMGLESILSNATSQDEFTSTLTSLTEMINYRASDFLYMSVIAIALMVFHVGVTSLIFAAYQKKEGKRLYVFSFVTYFIIQLIGAMANYNVIPNGVKALITALVAAFVAFIGLKVYNIHYKNEEPKEKARIEKEKTKMPKFDNLSKL